MMCVVLRKGTAAAHYIMGGPQATRNNAFTLGVPTTEIYVMHGETAAAAAFSRRLVKEKDAGKPIEPVIDKMNAGQYTVQKQGWWTRSPEWLHSGTILLVLRDAVIKTRPVSAPIIICCFRDPSGGRE